MRRLEFDQVVWLLDQRFDFLLPWFEKEYNISRKDILFVGSYHGNTRKKLKKVTVGDSLDGHVSYLEPEDINKMYAGEITRDKKTLIVPFSGAYLPSEENVASFIATGNIATYINNKRWQYEFFSKIGVKTPKTWRAENHFQLLNLTGTLFDQYERLLIKKAELAGGYKMEIVSSVEEVREYCEMQTEDFLNNEFLVSEYIPHKQSFSGMGIISRNGKTIWCGITEQVLYQDLAYEGLIWPPYIDDAGLCDIKNITLKVGKSLSELVYFGYFNVDFIQGTDEMYAIEINARFCFSTIFYACCCGEKFWKAVQDEEIIESQVEGRLVLGKIKAREDKSYSELADKSNILDWFNNGTGGFESYFVGTDQPEHYDYGSFIGLFGEFLPKDASRDETLRLFWDRCLQHYKQKKTILCMYVDDFCGINKESFNFYIKRRYMIKEGEISRKSNEEIEDFPNDFWGITGSAANVSAVTLLIGENGAGKTTLMRLLIKWLCQLSVGNIPQEKGALVISVDGEDKLIAFDGGETWSIVINKNEIECIENKWEIKQLLSDIRLAYYTDTMTDLELSDMLTEKELTFLQDDSLLARLSNSMQGRYTADSVKDCIKREEFKRQMNLFLHIKESSKEQQNPKKEWEFPIYYMKFTAMKTGDESSFKWISDDNSGLIGEAIALWNNVFAIDANNDNLPDIAKALLWGLFSGTITSLLRWERTLPYLETSIITEPVRASLRAYIRINYDWNTVFIRFFENLFNDCERAFNAVHRFKEFHAVWDKQMRNINSFLDVLNNIKNGKFLKKWTLSENAQNVWAFKLEYFNEKDESDQTDTDDEKKEPNMLQEWIYLWENYLKVANLMPECRFYWMYPSSGEANKANLYCTMRVVDKGGYSNTWFLLDEPDNTFHPDWKRETILDLLNKCSVYDDLYFQLFISTHSPIMLSHVPKQAAILLKSGENEEKEENDKKIEYKLQKSPEASPFGQQIYTLFNDAFFMKQGIIGAFADMKIGKVYKELSDIEEQLSMGEKIQDKNKLNFELNLKEYESIIKLIEEPLLHGHLSQSYKLCKQRIKGLR